MAALSRSIIRLLLRANRLACSDLKRSFRESDATRLHATEAARGFLALMLFAGSRFFVPVGRRSHAVI